jgi:hypothetical protein
MTVAICKSASAPVQPDNSGGPLLDASGHLVGIVTAKLNALRMARYTGDIAENVNFALKAEVARTFLDSKGIKYQMAPSDKQLSPADVGDIGRQFTVHIQCERTGPPPVAAVGSVNPSQDQQTEPCKDYVHPSSLSKKTVDAIIEACSIVIGSTRRAPTAQSMKECAHHFAQIGKDVSKCPGDRRGDAEAEQQGDDAEKHREENAGWGPHDLLRAYQG